MMFKYMIFKHLQSYFKTLLKAMHKRTLWLQTQTNVYIWYSYLFMLFNSTQANYRRWL